MPRYWCGAVTEVSVSPIPLPAVGDEQWVLWDHKGTERRRVQRAVVHVGGLGGVLGFPLGTGGPAHRPYTRPRCP